MIAVPIKLVERQDFKPVFRNMGIQDMPEDEINAEEKENDKEKDDDKKDK